MTQDHPAPRKTRPAGGAARQRARKRPGERVEATVTVSGAPPPARLARWSGEILTAAAALRPRRSGDGAEASGLSVLVCGDARMRRLNRTWLGIDRPTDVLSFPAGPGTLLGDVAIDLPYARRQALAGGHPLAREVQILLVHGVLHVLGYDHETDDGEMFRLQARLVRRVFGPGPDGVPRRSACSVPGA